MTDIVDYAIFTSPRGEYKITIGNVEGTYDIYISREENRAEVSTDVRRGEAAVPGRLVWKQVARRVFPNAYSIIERNKAARMMSTDEAYTHFLKTMISANSANYYQISPFVVGFDDFEVMLPLRTKVFINKRKYKPYEIVGETHDSYILLDDDEEEVEVLKPELEEAANAVWQEEYRQRYSKYF